jgi:hypothetical protein
MHERGAAMANVHRPGGGRVVLALAALVTTATLIVVTSRPEPAAAATDAATDPSATVSGSATVHDRHVTGEVGRMNWEDRASDSSDGSDNLDDLDKLGDLTDAADPDDPTETDDLTGSDDPRGTDDPGATDNRNGADDRNGTDNRRGADDRAAVPGARHWYLVPTVANACRLNLRKRPSVDSPVLMRLRTCGKGPWCWEQTHACGAGSDAEIVGDLYRCIDDTGAVISSDRWLPVALTSRQRAFVAADCATSVRT